jgi:hypothetical protein
MLATLTLLISSAWAAPDYPENWNSTRLVIRGVAETWDDAGITSNYGMGGVGLGLAIMQPIWGPLAIDIEFTYKRMREGGKNLSNEEYDGRLLQLIPVTAIIEYRAPISTIPIELFFGTGPSIVSYAENLQRTEYMDTVVKANQKPGLRLPNEPEATSDTVGDVIRGARPCIEVRAGIRIDPGFIRKPMAPATAGPLSGVEFEIYGARRFTSSDNGFNLNTWRAGVGMGLRF